MRSYAVMQFIAMGMAVVVAGAQEHREVTVKAEPLAIPSVSTLKHPPVIPAVFEQGPSGKAIRYVF